MNSKAWRFGWALAPLMTLGACGMGAGHGPFVDSRPPPGLAERFYPPESWTWGLIQVGDAPAQRYGVAAPEVTARADVLILPDNGESAETWYETARDLRSSGYAVWVLEAVGQGGSGRGGKAGGVDADVAATRAMIDMVIRPPPRRPLILLGAGAGGLIAARAVETGARPAALILSGVSCDDPPPPGAWRREGSDDFAIHRTHDAWRGAVTHAWQIANPDLRPAGPSDMSQVATLRSGAVDDAARLQLPTLVLDAGKPGCLSPPGATRQTIADAGPALELEDDARRGPWLTAIRAAIVAATTRADPLTAAHAS